MCWQDYEIGRRIYSESFTVQPTGSAVIAPDANRVGVVLVNNDQGGAALLRVGSDSTGHVLANSNYYAGTARVLLTEYGQVVQGPLYVDANAAGGGCSYTLLKLSPGEEPSRWTHH